MKILQPRDIKTEADGHFPCGRKSGFEAREFRMPLNECEDCVIELEYTFNNTKAYYCSDVALFKQNEMPSLKTIQIGDIEDGCEGLC